MLVTCTFRITGFDFIYGRPAFSAAPPTVMGYSTLIDAPR